MASPEQLCAVQAGARLGQLLIQSDWRCRHAALICLAQIAEGCSKVLGTQLRGLVDMCQKVRFVACFAEMSQLSRPRSPDLPGPDCGGLLQGPGHPAPQPGQIVPEGAHCELNSKQACAALSVNAKVAEDCDQNLDCDQNSAPFQLRCLVCVCLEAAAFQDTLAFVCICTAACVAHHQSDSLHDNPQVSQGVCGLCGQQEGAWAVGVLQSYGKSELKI